MSRLTSVQRWSSLVLLATLVSLMLFYALPAIVFRAARAWEMGRTSVAAETVAQAGAAARREQQAEIEGVRRASRRVLPAVVHIEAIHEPTSGSHIAQVVEHNREPATTHHIARGCGLVIGHEGEVLTNYAVVAGAREIYLQIPRRRGSHFARFIGGDPDTDLAILRMDPPVHDLSVAELNGQELPGIGERVIAIGSADQIDHLLWVGTVQSEGRDVPAAGCLPQDFIQTSAVNPWNAGGPLLNARGDVIGINSTFVAGASVQSGMVVPALIALRVAALLRAKGRVERGWLGVYLHRVDRSLRSEAAEAAYALDYVVPESPAGKAGLRSGDWIIRVRGRTFPSASDLRRWIAVTSPMTELVVSLIREEREIERHVVVEPCPDEPPLLPGEAEWGVRVLCHISAEDRRAAGIDSGEGVVIQAVSAAAHAARLKPGETIIEVNGTPTRCLEDFCREVQRWRESSPNGVAQLTVQSRGTKRRVEIASPDVALRSSPR